MLKHKTVQFNKKHRYIGKKPKLCAVCTSNRLSNKSTDSAWLVSFLLLYFEKHFLQYGALCRHSVILALIFLCSLLSPFTAKLMQHFSVKCRYCSVSHSHLRTSCLKSQPFVRGNKIRAEILKWVAVS